VLALLAALPALAVSPSDPQSLLNAERKDGTPHDVQFRLHGEVGFVAPLAHSIQFGTDGTYFDYVKEGGQDVLFPFLRLSADVDVKKRNTFVLLYQPLEIFTQTTMQRDVTWDGVVFPAGTPVDLRYGFSFWRGSWMYDLKPGPEREIAIGGSLQIRNANIEATSVDGTLRSVNRDVGPVPTIKTRMRFPLKNEGWIGGEVDAAWAPIRYINGSDSDVEGALVDGSLRLGTELRPGLDAVMNVRYLGGGAVGTSDSSTPPGDGYNRNWLHTMTLTVGFDVR
jgi:hypothetical protein